MVELGARRNRATAHPPPKPSLKHLVLSGKLSPTSQISRTSRHAPLGLQLRPYSTVTQQHCLHHYRELYHVSLYKRGCPWPSQLDSGHFDEAGSPSHPTNCRAWELKGLPCGPCGCRQQVGVRGLERSDSLDPVKHKMPAQRPPGAMLPSLCHLFLCEAAWVKASRGSNLSSRKVYSALTT